MRARLLVLFVLAATAALSGQSPPQQPPPQPPPSPAPPPAAAQQQPPPRPTFRAGVDILTVDATVVDREGKQVTDLRPEDFTVEVDGDPRPVVTAEYVKLVDDTPVPIGTPRPGPPKPSPDEIFFSTNNKSVSAGRLIVLLVDQGNIRVGQGRHMMRSAVKFVDQLAPADRVAMVAIPRGQLVDFTTNHERIREALLATVGLASPFKGRFHISLSEAIATVERSDAQMRAQLMMRECGDVLSSPADIARCEIEVEQECSEIVSHQRLQTQDSLRAMREVLKSIGAIDGPKSVIVISEGLVMEGLGNDVDEIAAIAADSRASLDVMLLDVPAVDVTESQRPTTPREDRDRQVAGLETLAGVSRGQLHRIVTSGDNAFVKVLRSISGYYLLGVESRPRDRDGRRHRIQVKSSRRGMTVLARRGFLAPTSPGATTPADAVSKALRAPLTLNELPMRMTTWTYKEPGGPRVRVMLTAEIERTADQALDYTTGIAVMDRNNRVVVNNVAPQKLETNESDSALAVFLGSVLVEPGTYLLRLAVADSEGRLGSIERKVDAWQMNATGLTVGDLLVTQAPSGGNGIVSFGIEPLVSNGRLAAVMEIYSPQLASLDGLKASLDVVTSETTRPLASSPMQIAQGSSPEIGVLQASVNTNALPPGRYLARAMIFQNGRPQGHIYRPFRVAAAANSSVANASAATTGVSMPSPLPPELLGAMLSNLPTFDRKEFLDPTVLTAVFGAAEKSRPTAKAALASAKAGKLGPAALEALEAGDQPIAAFIRGIDFFSQGLTDRALQQFQVAMQQAPSFVPVRLYLGAALVQINRHREAAGLLQSVTPDIAGPAPVARLAGLSWLRAGDASLAITALEKAADPGDSAATRTLALAYVAGNRPADAIPLLARCLETSPNDADILLAAVYATYATHTPSPRGETLVADRTRAQTWAKAYAAQKGAHQPLVDAWIAYLQGPK
jgi:VWFA-related protein